MASGADEVGLASCMRLKAFQSGFGSSYRSDLAQAVSQASAFGLAVDGVCKKRPGQRESALPGSKGYGRKETGTEAHHTVSTAPLPAPQQTDSGVARSTYPVWPAFRSGQIRPKH